MVCKLVGLYRKWYANRTTTSLLTYLVTALSCYTADCKPHFAMTNDCSDWCSLKDAGRISTPSGLTTPLAKQLARYVELLHAHCTPSQSALGTRLRSLNCRLQGELRRLHWCCIACSTGSWGSNTGSWGILGIDKTWRPNRSHPETGHSECTRPHA